MFVSALVSAVGTSTVADTTSTSCAVPSSAANGGENALLLSGLGSAGTAASEAMPAGASVEVAMVVGIKLEISRWRARDHSLVHCLDLPVPDTRQSQAVGYGFYPIPTRSDQTYGTVHKDAQMYKRYPLPSLCSVFC